MKEQEKNEPNEDDFIDLANSVEEFTLRFLDPLKHEKPWREAFALNPETDILLDVAIKLKQKKVISKLLRNKRLYNKLLAPVFSTLLLGN